jgi:hypothetical protein
MDPVVFDVYVVEEQLGLAVPELQLDGNATFFLTVEAVVF